MKKGKIFGIEIAAASRKDILGYCEHLMDEGGAISTVNPEILANSLKDSELRSALRQSFNVPDGVGVERALLLRGVQCQRFPGVELGEALLERRRSTLAIIGGRCGVAQRALARLAAAHRMVTPSFAADGYSHSDEELVGLLLSHEPNLVFVCLGSPKQEIFIKRARRALPKALFVALGGSVDIYSGDKKRAPAAFRRLGCEWIYRTLCDGRRIKRVPKLFVFAYNALKEGAVLRKSTEKTVK